MMSYQDCRPLFKYHEEELIALFVETLTGTTFEMTVSPYDTIMSIKNKIQRVEGIPVGQQHLLYNLRELDDSAILMDYSITNGSTIKLVLSMRGGPISTVRRILPLDDIAWRELVEFNRDDLLDDLPPGCRMAVLVFREGDQLNMFRVLENIDGSYSPLSDSCSGSSLRNLFEEEDSDEYAKRLEENTVTMEKMNDLKNKMEELAIQRKNRKLKPVRDPEIIEEERTFTEDTFSRPRRASSVNCYSRHKSFVQLPPLSTDTDEIDEIEPEGRIRKTARATEFSRVPVLPEITPRTSPPHIAILDSELEPIAIGGSPLPRPKTSPDHLTGRQICEILSEAGRNRILRTMYSHHYSASPIHSIPRGPPESSASFDSDWCSSQLSTSTVLGSKGKEKPPTAAAGLLRAPLNHRPNNISPQGKAHRTAIISPFNIFSGRSSRDSVNPLFSNSSKLDNIPVTHVQALPLKRNEMPHSSSGKPSKTINVPKSSIFHFSKSHGSGETTASSARAKTFERVPVSLPHHKPVQRTSLYSSAFAEERNKLSDTDNKSEVFHFGRASRSGESTAASARAKTFESVPVTLPHHKPVQRTGLYSPSFAEEQTKLDDTDNKSDAFHFGRASRSSESTVASSQAKTIEGVPISLPHHKPAQRTGLYSPSFVEERNKLGDTDNKSEVFHFGRASRSGESTAASSRTKAFETVPVSHHKPVPIVRTALYSPSFIEESNKISDSFDKSDSFYDSSEHISSTKLLRNNGETNFDGGKRHKNFLTASLNPINILHNLDDSKVPINKSPLVENNDSLVDSETKKKKKEPRRRCAMCKKRLTLTNIYTCRCGNLFCNIHRYSEAHICDYDYKGEGRKLLERNNPLVTAPKLPKI